jgi:hypothetical protein
VGQKDWSVRACGLDSPPRMGVPHVLLIDMANLLLHPPSAPFHSHDEDLPRPSPPLPIASPLFRSHGKYLIPSPSPSLTSP